jgi:hypothetical protein
VSDLINYQGLQDVLIMVEVCLERAITYSASCPVTRFGFKASREQETYLEHTSLDFKCPLIFFSSSKTANTLLFRVEI